MGSRRSRPRQIAAFGGGYFWYVPAVIERSRAFLSAWRRIAALAAAMCVAAGFLACGEDAPQAKIILTAVRVEERGPDGSWSPVADVHVDYQIWAGRATSSADVVLFYEYEDFTDESGLSVVAQAADDKKPADIGLLFAEVTHDDGRTGFQRKQVEGGVRSAGVVRDFLVGAGGCGFGYRRDLRDRRRARQLREIP